MGNLRSVERALAHLGFSCKIQPNLKGATRLILPGVGAFGAAMERLASVADDIRAFAKEGSPVLGICLGQQLLMEYSEELGEHRGLGLLEGRVRYLPRDREVKVPHVGWNSLKAIRAGSMFEGVPEGRQVYFVHSLYTDCENPADVAALCEHGITFPAAVCRGNLWGTQFHPEKSGEVGLRVLSNWMRC